MVLLLPGSILLLTDRTEDFRVTFCAFSRDLFAEAAFRLDPSFFRTLGERPISYPPARVVEGAAIWFQMAAYTYRDRNNVFRNTIIKNRLQNVLLESYDKMQRFAARQPRTPEVTTRQTDLSSVSWPSCTNTARRNARSRSMPTNSAYRPVTSRPSCGAWRGVRPRSSSTGR